MAKRKAKKKISYLVLQVPPWVGKMYVGMAIVLIPWTIYLGSTLPQHHLSSHWDISWTGMDIAICIALLFTGLFAYLRSVLLIIAASTTGSLLLLDAWFDIMSEHAGGPFHQAIFLAVFIEGPLAILSYYVAIHALRRNKLRLNRGRV